MQAPFSGQPEYYSLLSRPTWQGRLNKRDDLKGKHSNFLCGRCFFCEKKGGYRVLKSVAALLLIRHVGQRCDADFFTSHKIASVVPLEGIQ